MLKYLLEPSQTHNILHHIPSCQTLCPCILAGTMKKLRFWETLVLPRTLTFNAQVNLVVPCLQSHLHFSAGGEWRCLCKQANLLEVIVKGLYIYIYGCKLTSLSNTVANFFSATFTKWFCVPLGPFSRYFDINASLYAQAKYTSLAGSVVCQSWSLPACKHIDKKKRKHLKIKLKLKKTCQW